MFQVPESIEDANAAISIDHDPYRQSCQQLALLAFRKSRCSVVSTSSACLHRYFTMSLNTVPAWDGWCRAGATSSENSHRNNGHVSLEMKPKPNWVQANHMKSSVSNQCCNL